MQPYAQIPFTAKKQKKNKTTPINQIIVQSGTCCPFLSTEGLTAGEKKKQWSSTMLSGLIL